MISKYSLSSLEILIKENPIIDLSIEIIDKFNFVTYQTKR